MGIDLFKDNIKINEDDEIVSVETIDSQSPRFNFDNFQNSLITCFILIGEDW